jgi:hypothetical protein
MKTFGLRAGLDPASRVAVLPVIVAWCSGSERCAPPSLVLVALLPGTEAHRQAGELANKVVQTLHFYLSGCSERSTARDGAEQQVRLNS